jgi:NAD(P)H-hydrate epimerase
MRVVNNQQMQTIDRWAIKKLGIPSAVLMENAGRGCVDILQGYFELDNLNVLVICGPGNNGGDGFVIARHLMNRRASVKVVLTGKADTLSGDARTNYNILIRTGIEVIEIKTAAALRNLIDRHHPELIIDAIFGTGYKGNLSNLYAKIFDVMNDTDAFILSVDIPSGIIGDTGQFDRSCVIADATAVMCLPKHGNILYPGRDFCGDTQIVDIGIPYSLINNEFPQLIEFETIERLLPLRPPDGNKGTFGQILIIAGARGYSGAAAMAARAALKTGAGLVRLAAPQCVIQAVEGNTMETVKIPLKETAAGTISAAAQAQLKTALSKSDVVVIGPGLTTDPETARFVKNILPKINVPLIVDADALNIIAGDIRLLKKIKAPCLITPHPGELSRLSAYKPGHINDHRIDIAAGFAKKHKLSIVLKGAPTVIADADGKVYINPTGNSGLASAGSGDVLVGMIAAFLGQGATLMNAAQLGVFMHGLSADLIAHETNEYSITAGDVLNHIGQAFNFILRRSFKDMNKND